MFTLDTHAENFWRDTFIVLSWQPIEKYLPLIKFPLLSEVNVIQEISQTFVSELNEVGRLNEALNRTYNNLLQSIGEQDLIKFALWGETLNTDSQLHYSLRLIWEVFRLNLVNEELSFLSPDSANIFRHLVAGCHSSIRELDDAIDHLETVLLTDDWGREMLKAYNDREYEGNTIESPLDVLSAWGFDVNLKSLIRSLHQALTDNELISLNHCIKNTNNWKQSISRPTPAFFQPIEFVEIIGFI